MSNKYILLFAIVLGSIVVDQWSKQLAVRYLRSPSDRDFRSEHFEPCTKKRKKCESLCEARAKTSKISLVACQRTCKRQETLCRDRLNPSYEQAKAAWKKELLPALQSSNMCRYIKFANASRPECVVIKNYFHFTYRTNSGAAWGIFSSLEDRVRRPFFICITLIAIMFIFYLFIFRLETEHRLMIVALALILGGALGNFLDRLRLDYVIDFIEWFWRDRAQLTWPTFNIADAAISIGVGLIAIELFFFPQDDFDFHEEPDEDGNKAATTASEPAAALNVAAGSPTAAATAPSLTEVSAADGDANAAAPDSKSDEPAASAAGADATPATPDAKDGAAEDATSTAASDAASTTAATGSDDADAAKASASSEDAPQSTPEVTKDDEPETKSKGDDGST